MSSRVEARRVIAVAFMALAIMGVILARSASAADVVDTTRVAGTNRYGTACEAAKAAFPGGTSTAIIATGENFPDALAAAGLAGDQSAPVLLVQRDAVPSETSSCLQQLGVTKVVIVGGPAAVSAAVEQELAQDYAVSRSSGADRYGTAAAVAQDMNAVCSLTGGTTAIIATGENYPDALSAGPLAYIGDGTDACPILLVHRDGVPQATKDALAALGIDNIIVMGGTSAVSSGTMAELASLTGDSTPTRLAGATREGTAADAASALRDTFGCNIDTVIIAGGRPQSGQTFAPDPLSASALGGERCAPILLIPSPNELGDDAAGFITANHDTITDVIGVGGTAVVSNGVLSQAEGAAETGTTTTTSSSTTSSTSSTTTTTVLGAVNATVRPELTNASFTTVTVAKAPTASSPGRQVGTYVTYTFDEPVLNTDVALLENLFFVYDADNNRYTGTTDIYETRPRLDSTGTKVEVFFNAAALQTTAGSARLTVASVGFGAAKDSDGNFNPEGATSIGTAATSTVTGGKTDAPDLSTVSGFTDGPGTTTGVTLTFDQKAWRAVGEDVELVLSNGERVACAYAGTGDGTTSVKYNCDEPVDPVAFGYNIKYTSAQVARAVIHEGSFSAASGSGAENPLESVNSGGSSTSPDLTAVSGTPGATTLDSDTVVYTFDEALTGAPGSAANFHVYFADGSTHDGTGVTWSGSTPKLVAISYPHGTLDSAVGASVETGAATGTGGTAIQAAELPMSGAAATTRTPGETVAPNLKTVEIKAGDALGTFYTATYTFDENVAGKSDADFYLYEADGTRHQAGLCTIGTSPNGNQVTCTFGVATAAQVHRSVVGTVAFGAADDGTNGSPEGAARAAGSNGTAA